MQENNLVSTPVSPEATPQVLPEQPKQNNFLTILLSVLLFLSVLIAGFFAYQTQNLVKELTDLKNEKKVVATSSTEPTVEPIATGSSTIDPTLNWNTYTNNTYGFSVKYPKSWTEITTEEEKMQGNAGYTNLYTILKTEKGEFVSINVFDGPAKSSQNTESSKSFDLENNKSVLVTYTNNLGPGSKPGVIDILTFSSVLSTFKLTN